MDEEEVNKGIRAVRVMKKIMSIFKQRMKCYFKEMNLTGPQGMLIGTLSHYGEMKVSDLSERLDLSNSTVSGIIDRLEIQGLVQRTRSKEDRRVVYVNATPACVKNFQDIHEKINTLFEEAINKSTPEEMDIILKGLDTLEKVIEREYE